MPKIHTHLHLGIKLLHHIRLDNPTSFLLGNAYPDCWRQSISQAMANHHKETVDGSCDLERFLQREKLDDFYMGYFFHLWVDNAIANVDLQDISKYDCMICDMEIIGEFIAQLDGAERTEKEKKAIENIRVLENEPMPLYLVDEEKKQRYDKILEELVRGFLENAHSYYSPEK